MIELCAIETQAYRVCNICRVCSLLPKVSWENSSEGFLGEPYTCYTGTAMPSQLLIWYGTVGRAFFCLQRPCELVEAEMRTHKESLQ